MLRAMSVSLALLLCAGCGSQSGPASADGALAAVPDHDQLLDQLSGVWRGADSGTLLYLPRDSQRLRMFIPEGEVPVRMGSVDVAEGTINLTVDDGARQLVWTLSKVVERDGGSFHLRVTVDDGQQQDFSFVRAVSEEDQRHLRTLAPAELRHAALAALVTGGEVPGISVDGEAVSEETGVSGDVDAPEADADVEAEADASVRIMAGDVAPSFDCSKQLNAAESLVCGDEEVAELDRRLSKAYRLVLSRSDQPEAERSIQMRWLADKRNACDTVVCLRKAYRQRLKYFEGAPYYAYSEYAEGG